MSSYKLLPIPTLFLLQIEGPGERVREHGLGHSTGGERAAAASLGGGGLQESLSKAIENPTLSLVSGEAKTESRRLKGTYPQRQRKVLLSFLFEISAKFKFKLNLSVTKHSFPPVTSATLAAAATPDSALSSDEARAQLEQGFRAKGD